MQDSPNTNLRTARRLKNWLLRLGTVDILTAVLALLAGIQLWGFIKGERAFVYAASVTLPQGLSKVDPLPMSLEIKNGGKGVATIQEVAAAITQGPLPMTPQYASAPRFAFPPAVAGSVVKRPLSFPLTGGYSEEKVGLLKSRKESLYFYGVIRYQDGYSFPTIFGFRETGFCFVYAPEGANDGFETCKEPAYTYAN